MPVTVSCCAGPNELLRAILLTLVEIEAGGGSTSTLQSGSQSIASGVDTVTVVFPTPYTTAPTVVATINRPVAEDLIQLNIDKASVTTTGFTASLSATTGSANYNINWFAN